jgi:NAD(P)-dependent dehydrogenase (short-subunit alcohol dehydrogenase family)
MEPKGKSVLITGGSQGLGRALGARLAAAGARVVLVARGETALDDAVAEIRRAGGEAHGIAADVGEPRAAARIAAEAAERVGLIDVLVLNASTLGPVPMPLLSDLDASALLRVFEVNLFGAFRLAKHVVGSMLLRGEGLVLTVSSDAAVDAYPSWGAYGASKAALDHLARVWGAELEGTGVRLLAIDPGEMDTDMHAAALPDADPKALQRPADVAEVFAAIVASERRTGARIAAPSWQITDGGGS